MTEDLAAIIAKEATKADLYLSPCGCYSLPRECMLFSPENYSKLKKAVHAWAVHSINKTSHWSVHWNHRHILHVKNRFGVKALPGD